MNKKRTIDINELERILKEYFDYGNVSIECIYTGSRIDDMQIITLGLGSILELCFEGREHTIKEGILDKTEYMIIMKHISKIEEDIANMYSKGRR